MKDLFIEIQKERRMIFVLAMAVFLILQNVSAPVWGAPTAAPPSGDISAPIFGSYSAQTRLGALTIAGLVSVGSNLVVGGTGYFNGSTQIDGILTMNSRANVCIMVYYPHGFPNVSCGANYYAVGVTNTSYIVQNPASPSQEGYMICCKNND
jgi:hypothetical protein